jgi:hypothetical protein
MAKFQQGVFVPKNIKKYAGTKSIKFRSSWELAFCQFCDNNKNVITWSSEPLRIPYVNPLTGKKSSYVPDFLVQYMDKNGSQRAELIEIKPSTQITMESAKTNNDKAAVIVNTAKWQAAQAFCKHKGIAFRIISEKEMFRQGKPPTKPRRR